MNTQVVLARAHRAGATTGRPSADGPPEVHAYRIGEDGSALWTSACGIQLASNDAEIVDRFTGTPCTTCFLLAIVSDDSTPITRTELEAPPHDVAPNNGASAPARYVASWRERVLHLLDSNSPSTELDGEPVVMARCGHLGWTTTDLPDWPRCAECAQHLTTDRGRPAPTGPPIPTTVDITPRATGIGGTADEPPANPERAP